MSRLTDLIAQVKAKDPQMGADLEREYKALSSRLPFGLNFERHRPKASGEAEQAPAVPTGPGQQLNGLERITNNAFDQKLVARPGRSR